MSTTKSIVSNPSQQLKRESIWSHIGLLPLAGLMLAIAAVWRLVDVFVLRLGETWLNIMPSKLFPFLIIVGFFFRYRRDEVSTVLGLNRSQLRIQLALGFILGCSMYLLLDVVPTIIYATFFDVSYPLIVNMLFVDILWYQFVFFLTNALLEETLFRGLIQNGLRSRFTPNRAIVISALAFGLWHLCWPIIRGLTGDFSPSEAAALLVFSAIVGVFFGTYYEKFSSRMTLTGPIMIHTLINFFNECIKLGPDSSVQGPDITFRSPMLLVLTFLFLVLTLGAFIRLSWSSRIEQVESWWIRQKNRVIMIARGLMALRHVRTDM